MESGIFGIPQSVRNNMRLSITSARFWLGERLVIAACEGADDYLIWFDFNTAPCVTVPATDAARQDFREHVFPLIQAGQVADRALCTANQDVIVAEAEWGLRALDEMAEVFKTGRYEIPPGLLPRPMGTVAACQEAFMRAELAITTAAQAFFERHGLK